MKSILRKLVDDRVLDVELLNEGKAVKLMEWCDEYFSTVLNKDEFRQFID